MFFTGPSALTVTIIKLNDTLSIVVQWDVVDDFLDTNYGVTWTSRRNHVQAVGLIEQTSYTITGLTLDTVYTITVAAVNICGNGPEFRTSITFSTGTTSTTNISPTVTASTNPMTTMCIAYYLNARLYIVRNLKSVSYIIIPKVSKTNAEHCI